MLGLDVARIDLCPHSIRSWHPLWYLGHLPTHGVPFMALWESTEFELGNQPSSPVPSPQPAPCPPKERAPGRKVWLTPNLWLPVSRSLGNWPIKTFSGGLGGKSRGRALAEHCVRPWVLVPPLERRKEGGSHPELRSHLFCTVKVSKLLLVLWVKQGLMCARQVLCRYDRAPAQKQWLLVPRF